MTRDELIAKVYELCGRKREVIGRRVYWRHPDYQHYIWPEAVGLDDFVRDIVPVLNERGWGFTLRLTFAHPDGRIRWVAVSNPRESDEWPYQHISPDPVEAAFAVALEVLGE